MHPLNSVSLTHFTITHSPQISVIITVYFFSLAIIVDKKCFALDTNNSNSNTSTTEAATGQLNSASPLNQSQLYSPFMKRPIINQSFSPPLKLFFQRRSGPAWRVSCIRRFVFFPPNVFPSERRGFCGVARGEVLTKAVFNGLSYMGDI